MVSFHYTEIYKSFYCNSLIDAGGTFLDISKALAKVWHDGLIYKLMSRGVENKLLNLNYLTNRQQSVLLNGQTSKWTNILAGVPQGSVLGPSSFLIYINYLSDDLKYAKCLQMYVTIFEN